VCVRHISLDGEGNALYPVLSLCICQGAEIISQSSRIDAEDEASSDDDKSLPEDSAGDSDDVCYTSLLASFTLSRV